MADGTLTRQTAREGGEKSGGAAGVRPPRPRRVPERGEARYPSSL